MSKKTATTTQTLKVWRPRVLLCGFILCALGLAARSLLLQVFDDGFLENQGDARHLRVAKLSAHRGPILDRNGEPLAVSTPVDSVWANPRELAPAADRLEQLAQLIDRDSKWLLRRITQGMSREFVYLRRHMRPDHAARVMALDLPGVYLLREYRRYYPAGEVTGHLLGFTNIDDQGQEGLELAFDHWLRGESGSKQVLQDRLGRTIEDVQSLHPPRPGRPLTLSLDLDIQYLAYRELKRAIQQHDASSGSVVVLDVNTGEVLAMANQPSYNPNDRSQYSVARYRNRACTDIFEPGSSLKPLVVAAALESGRFDASTPIDTNPGHLKVGAKLITDVRNFGQLDVTGVLTKSSNVGVTKISLGLEPEQLWRVLSRFGIGRLTSSGFPGESAGLLNNHVHWRAIGQATLAYGYGLSSTPLQVTQAYAALGAEGVRHPVTFIRQESAANGERVISAATANSVLTMMESVVTAEGTGLRAAVRGYRVAGKTGTAHKFEAGGYSDDRYTAMFAGVAPVADPRLAIVVVIDEPSREVHFGGDVAAPVFSAVMGGALRLRAIEPDDQDAVPAATLLQATARLREDPEAPQLPGPEPRP